MTSSSAIADRLHCRVH